MIGHDECIGTQTQDHKDRGAESPIAYHGDNTL